MSARHVVLLRHGTTDSSALGHFTGRSNPPLNGEGIAQASAWRDTLAQWKSVRAFRSPLDRATDTARLAGADAVELAELTEWDLGVLDGLGANEYRAAHPEWSLFRDGPPQDSGERPATVVARAHRVIEVAIDGVPDGSTSVLVSHGQFMRVLATAILGIPIEAAARLSCGPGRAAVFSLRGGGYSLTGWNQVPPRRADEFFVGLT